MAKEIIFLVEESLEGRYEARALDYSIYTETDQASYREATGRRRSLIHSMSTLRH